MSQLELFATQDPEAVTVHLRAIYVEHFGHRPLDFEWEQRQQVALSEAMDDPLKLRQFADQALRERIGAELALASAIRHLTALLGEPLGAPEYRGTWWTSACLWTGPFHLVPVSLVPYPGSPELPLPDVELPDKKAFCGYAYHGQPHRWPYAHEVCPDCARLAADRMVRP